MILTILSLIAAVLCYTVSQLLIQHKFIWQNEQEDYFSFWGRNSWVRKYAGNHERAAIFQNIKNQNWYYRFFKIKYKERFPLSATLLVFLTDGYHLTQAGFKLFLALSFAPLTGWIWAGVIWLCWGISFTIFYRSLSR